MVVIHTVSYSQRNQKEKSRSRYRHLPISDPLKERVQQNYLPSYIRDGQAKINTILSYPEWWSERKTLAREEVELGLRWYLKKVMGRSFAAEVFKPLFLSNAVCYPLDLFQSNQRKVLPYSSLPVALKLPYPGKITHSHYPSRFSSTERNCDKSAINGDWVIEYTI